MLFSTCQGCRCLTLVLVEFPSTFYYSFITFFPCQRRALDVYLTFLSRRSYKKRSIARVGKFQNKEKHSTNTISCLSICLSVLFVFSVQHHEHNRFRTVQLCPDFWHLNFYFDIVSRHLSSRSMILTESDICHVCVFVDVQWVIL